MRAILPSCALLGLCACVVPDYSSPDTDLDQLSDIVEWGLGSDPLDADSDDDGLLDGEEVDIGTLWLDSDSDDDGYSDRDEHVEGSDPLDDHSLIYAGGWPYYFEKTELNGGRKFEVGNRFANLQLVDQYGEIVSLWDFYNEDKYVIVDICVEWEGDVCDNLSRWVAGEHGASFDTWITVADAVDAGDMYWITILAEGTTPGVPITQDRITEWADAHPNPLVPVLADPEYAAVDFTDLGYYPYLVILDPDLKVHTFSSTGYTAVLDAAVDLLTTPSGELP